MHALAMPGLGLESWVGAHQRDVFESQSKIYELTTYVWVGIIFIQS